LKWSHDKHDASLGLELWLAYSLSNGRLVGSVSASSVGMYHQHR